MAQLLTRQDAAAELGVSLSTLTRLVRVHALPIVRVSERRVMVSRTALDRYASGREGFTRSRRRGQLAPCSVRVRSVAIQRATLPR
jgi:excisionase family DNA binding protein